MFRYKSVAPRHEDKQGGSSSKWKGRVKALEASPSWFRFPAPLLGRCEFVRPQEGRKVIVCVYCKQSAKSMCLKKAQLCWLGICLMEFEPGAWIKNLWLAGCYSFPKRDSPVVGRVCVSASCCLHTPAAPHNTQVGDANDAVRRLQGGETDASLFQT